MKKIFLNKYVQISLILILGFFLGWIFFHSHHEKAVAPAAVSQSEKETIWTCAMHPQIRMKGPGKCPICGMDLIPLNQSNSGTEPFAVKMTKEAVQLANVETTIVSTGRTEKEIRLYGKVKADERLLQNQVSQVPGRIEKLLINFTGEFVHKGQPVAVIYSPELVTAQQELLETAKMKDTQPEIYKAARERLSQWKLTDAQINDMEKSGNLNTDMNIVSGITGVVISKNVNAGDYISPGTVLFEVADLSRMWVVFDAYESDIPFIRQGDRISFTIQALPGANFEANINFIDPVIDPVTRVAKVRVEMDNTSGQLKPEMFATGIVMSAMNGSAGKPVIPRSSVLWTGKRSVVYVKVPGMDEPSFKMREIELGPMLGDSYIVDSGLTDGEEIVTRGTFSVDATAQLEGKPSMMNPEAAKISSMPGMEMPATVNESSGQQQGQMPGMDRTSPQQAQVDMNFIMQLNEVFSRYIDLKNALVQSDAKEAGNFAAKVHQALDNVDMKLVPGDKMDFWMGISAILVEQAGIMQSSRDIEGQRLAFSKFSSEFYKAVKAFGLMSKTAYYQFCPMAFNNQGAYWLSETGEIRNPYFGQKMLTCGKNTDTLDFK